jgi:hypothetical protein
VCTPLSTLHLLDVFLFIGEIGSLLVRGIFSFLVGLCDCLAAWSCCCQVPWAQRPNRTSYDFRSMGTNVGRGGVLASYTTKDGRAARQQVKDAKKKEAEMKKEDARVQKEEERKQKEKWAAEKKQADDKAKSAAAEAKKAVKAKK